LNRGYGMSRFDWPIHFGLLNQDCHWIVDEVQLMGPGLWTTAQLDWMRRKRFPGLRPCRTTWMSATMGTRFLQTTDRRKDGCDTVRSFEPGFEDDSNKALGLRRAALRPVEFHRPERGKKARPLVEQIASAAIAAHRPGTLTLIVCNTVRTAQEIFQATGQETEAGAAKRILLTSRFRAADRRDAEGTLLAFESRRSQGHLGAGDPGLICVSTQVVEAGLDISAHRLWTEHAPWPSLVQRLGRLNRDGKDNEARAVVWKITPESRRKHEGEEWIGPYRTVALNQASSLLEALAPISRQKTATEALAKLQAQMPEKYAEALAISPEPCPRALDVHGLFSTEPDLYGGFTDVSRFVRNGDPDADVLVFWRGWRGGPPPTGDALNGPPLDPDEEACPVALGRLQELLKSAQARAWLWDDRTERWEAVLPQNLRPGMTVMLRGEVGGYSRALGWTGAIGDRLEGLPPPGRGRALRDDWRSDAGYWSSLASHLADARRGAALICNALGLQGQVRAAAVEAAGLHDLGKAHPAWQNAIPAPRPAGCGAAAKFPKVFRVEALSQDGEGVRAAVMPKLAAASALPDEEVSGGKIARLRWALGCPLGRTTLEGIRALSAVRLAAHEAFRPGLRHEAASALAMWRQYTVASEPPYPALAVYLAAAHHGKVRTVLKAISREGGDVFGVNRAPAILQFDSRDWPMDFSVALDGADGEWTDGGFAPTGPGWTGLVADLLGPWRGEADAAWTGAVPKGEPRAFGPFALAWLEAIVRVADWRASDPPSDVVPVGGDR
jgi:CRISPR-associated endonuclease/helicase Cas3